MAGRSGLVAALAASLLTAAPAPARAATNSLTLEPSTGLAGATVSVAGSFPGYCGVRLWWEDAGAIALRDLPTSRTGGYAGTFTVPADAVTGDHPVVAEGLSPDPDAACAVPSGDRVTHPFTVVDPGAPPTPNLTLDTSTAQPGQAVVLDASGSIGSVASFEFDLDGNGTYETQCGGPSAASVINEPGTHEIGLRVVAVDGQSATTSAVLQVSGEAVTPPDDGQGHELLPFQEQSVVGTCLAGNPAYAEIVVKLWTCPQTLMVGTAEASFRTSGVNPARDDACFQRHEKTLFGTEVVFFVATKNDSTAYANPVLVNGLEFDHTGDRLPLYDNELMFLETFPALGSYGPYGPEEPWASEFRITVTTPDHKSRVASQPVSLLANWNLDAPGVVGSAVMGQPNFFATGTFLGLKAAKKLTPITFTADRRATLTLRLGLPLTGYKLATQTTAPLDLVAAGDGATPASPGKGPLPGSLNFTGIKLGIFGLDATLSYERQGVDDVWTGDMDLTFASGVKVGGILTIRNGSIETAHVAVGPGPPVPPGGLGPVGCCGWIYEVFGDLTTAYVAVGAVFGIGPTIPVLAVRVAEVTGTAKVFYGDPWAFLVSADDLKIASIPVHANAQVLIKSSGAWASAYLNQDWSVLELQANLEAKVSGSSWYGGGGATACVDIEVLHGCGAGWAGVGSGGLAACANIDYLPDGGVALDWDFFSGDLLAWSMYWGCSFGQVKTKIGAKQLAAARALEGRAAATVTLEAGMPKALIAVGGSGAAPKIRVRTPDGRILGSSAVDPLSSGTGWSVVEVPHDNTTYLWLRRPRGGQWQVGELEGSAPITRIGLAEGMPATVIRGSVTGTGRTRTLHYDVADVPGIRVTFFEYGGDPAAPDSPDLLQQQLGAARGGQSGTLRFTPVEGSERSRRIDAVIAVDGLPGRRQQVTTFLAPPLARLPAPSVTAIRVDDSARIGWTPVPGAASYRLVVGRSDADDIVVDKLADTTSARIRGLTPVTRAQITVQPMSRSGYFGKIGSATLRPLPETSVATRVSLKSVLRTGSLSGRCTAYADGSCSLRVLIGARVIASGSTTVAFSDTAVIVAPLTDAGRALLAKARRDLIATAIISAPTRLDVSTPLRLTR